MQTLQTILETLPSSALPLGIPNKKTECYRYFDIKELLEREISLHQIQKCEIEEANFVEIVDGVVTKAPKELKIAYTHERTIDANHFDPLYFASHALTQEVITIECSRDTEIKLHHRYTKSQTVMAYRIAFQIGTNAYVHISESFEGQEAQQSVVLYGYDLFASKDAHVEIIKDETLTQNIYTPLTSNTYKLEAQSEVKLFSFDFGEASGLELFSAEVGENANFDAKHLLYQKENGKRGRVTQIVHVGRGAQSSQVAKNILQDKARGIFDALIKIEQSAPGTKAHQNSKAILLNDGAYMASKPQLEIYIDDVEASHGSTTGELDEDQLFYIQSRGIAKDEARKMLILAFANEIIDAISQESVRESVHRSFETIYYGGAQLECISTCHHCSDTIIGEGT